MSGKLQSLSPKASWANKQPQLSLMIQSNVQKSLAFLYTFNSQAQRPIRNAIPFTVATKRIKTKTKNQCCRHHTTWLQTILKGYSNQNSMVLVPKQRYRPMKSNRGLRNNATHLKPSDLWQTWQKQAMGKGSLFNKWCWENWLAICRKLKVNPFLILYIKINSRWIKDLNIRPNTVKTLEENLGKTFQEIGIDKNFITKTPKALATKAKIHKWDLIKLYSFYTRKEIIIRVNQQPIEWKKFWNLPIRQRANIQNL